MLSVGHSESIETLGATYTRDVVPFHRFFLGWSWEPLGMVLKTGLSIWFGVDLLGGKRSIKPSEDGQQTLLSAGHVWRPIAAWERGQEKTFFLFYSLPFTGEGGRSLSPVLRPRNTVLPRREDNKNVIPHKQASKKGVPSTNSLLLRETTA